MSLFTAYLRSNRADVSPFARKNFIFCGLCTLIFLVINSGGVLRLSVSGKARFFPAV